MPTVTGFTANAALRGGKTGLNSTNKSVSPGVVTGTDLSAGLSVAVSASTTLNWAGTLRVENNQYQCDLTCTNTSTGDGDTQEVSVTVGTSDAYKTDVEVGT
jgi:hypothetical protein